MCSGGKQEKERINLTAKLVFREWSESQIWLQCWIQHSEKPPGQIFRAILANSGDWQHFAILAWWHVQVIFNSSSIKLYTKNFNFFSFNVTVFRKDFHVISMGCWRSYACLFSHQVEKPCKESGGFPTYWIQISHQICYVLTPGIQALIANVYGGFKLHFTPLEVRKFAKPKCSLSDSKNNTEYFKFI